MFIGDQVSVNLLAETVGGGDGDLCHVAAPKWKLKV